MHDTARVRGKTYSFRVKGAARPGMAVLYAVSPTEAVVLRPHAGGKKG